MQAIGLLITFTPYSTDATFPPLGRYWPQKPRDVIQELFAVKEENKRMIDIKINDLSLFKAGGYKAGSRKMLTPQDANRFCYQI